MNRTLKDATVKRFYYESHGFLRQHLTNFVAAYNFAHGLKTLKGLTPYEFVCRAGRKAPLAGRGQTGLCRALSSAEA